MQAQDKVQCALNGILEAFQSSEIPNALALAVHPTFDIPLAKWSLSNRLLAAIAGTEDARGFRQWKEAGRYVKKGAKSFTILAPRMRKVKDGDEEDGDEQTRQRLIGYLGVAVFRLEDTDGEELDYQQLELPSLPLLEVAASWGIDVKPVSGGEKFYGAFVPSQKVIQLASSEEMVFFHELAHAAHHRLTPLKSGQRWDQEIVAELSAACLCRLVGVKPLNLGHHHQYIEREAEKAKLTPVGACLAVIGDVEKVVGMIMAAGAQTGVEG